MKQNNMGGACSKRQKRLVRTKFWSKYPRETEHLEDMGIDGASELDSSGSGKGLVAISCEQGDQTVGSIKARNLLIRWATSSFLKTLLHGVSFHLKIPEINIKVVRIQGKHWRRIKIFLNDQLNEGAENLITSRVTYVII